MRRFERRWLTIIAVALMVGVALAPRPARALPDEPKCLRGRAQARARFEQCVHNWLAQVYAGSSPGQTRISKCREKFAAAWTKLQSLTGSATCTQPRFVNNGATVTDNLTGLVWEQKTDDSTDHDWDNSYTWSTADGDEGDEDGTAFTTLLANLNGGGGFGGANGWRLPTLAELLTLVAAPFPCPMGPCLDPAFGPYAQGNYWTATLHAAGVSAWVVNFADGDVNFNHTILPNSVRTVRGGL